jgi:anion-transporting  ArsA/GET3 family ATPase
VATRLTGRRLLVVTGKGGVGKSTTAAALGVAAARRGLRTIVAEVAGRSDVARVLGAEAAGGLTETELYPGLYHITIDRQPALEAYLRDEVPGPMPAAVLARSRTFQLFVEATPGMGELLTIGKLWELAQRPRHRRGGRQYDLVVLDGPASGQLVGLMAAPRTFKAIARSGPVARQAGAIDRMLTDPGSVGVVAVATPEQMPVSEAIELRGMLANEFGTELSAVVVNRTFPSRFSAKEAAALASVPDDPAVRAARWFYGRGRAQRTQLARLRRGLPEARHATLPFQFAGEPDRAVIEHLAELLDRSVL